MDNHFVPNLTLGLPVVKSLVRATDLPLDCHLMITDPDRWAPGYAEAGAANVTFHAEAARDPVGTARAIRAAGALAGLAVKPGTPIEPYLEVLKEFDTLLVMSVEPGFGGQRFMPEVLSKVRTAREQGQRRPAAAVHRDRRRHRRRHHRARPPRRAWTSSSRARRCTRAGDPAARGRATARAGPGGHGALRPRGRPAMTGSQPSDAEMAAIRLANDARGPGRRADQPEPGGRRGGARPGRPDRRRGRDPAGRQGACRGDGAGRGRAAGRSAAPWWSRSSRATTSAAPGRAPRR